MKFIDLALFKSDFKSYRLIQKVMKYRGLNRHKDDLNASTWFLEPGESFLLTGWVREIELQWSPINPDD
jgi:hypothetical protein